MKFSHLHNHTQYSLLDGASSIKNLFKKAIDNNMPAIAITDHGNMFGVFDFVNEAYKHKNDDGTLKVKPIIGCEFYIVADRTQQTFTKDKKDKRYHQVLLAKNEEGYKNLVKLCSLGFIEGLYGKYPRIDKQLLLQYHKGLIATTCCLGAEVPRAIVEKGEAEAELIFKWWLDIFGEDYFIEIQRHGIPEQEIVNEVLVRWSKKYNVPIIASNDSHYVEQEDANAHDILLCVNTGSKQAEPKSKGFDEEENTVTTKKRFAFYNNEFFFKSPKQMIEVFADLPQAIDNTNLVIDKIEPLKIARDILLPHFVVPAPFTTQDEYLAFLTWEGAKQKYKIITPEVEERITFELGVIQSMGFAGYFLIVGDFISAAKGMDVFVGPGRGSAAGSAVAYCVGITNIDPIKYKLLFERFLNPDRKSMPDIDTDFDDNGRQKVIDYVVEKYGKNQVAHIVTYGTMAAKSSIKDVARVMDLPLNESNELAKLVPDKPGTSLKRVLRAPLKGKGSLTEKEELGADDIANIEKLRAELNNVHSERCKVLLEAEKLEGTVRNTGIHAAGIIIAPQDLTTLIPVFKSKDVTLLVTQFEGSIIENAGVIKMDFLGLKNLTILKEALAMIKENHGIEIDLDNIPLDDELTYKLYQEGATNGTFQFESAGMQKYLKELKPDKFVDLIAMNALYRPGPIAYIPNFIERKHGREPISYDLPEMEEYLAETYGITTYQEQVMLLSQKLANFTKGDADVLRKAIGKKQLDVLNKMKDKFITGAATNGHAAETCEKIWKDWEAFAQYAFNKSHSTCYALVAFQTAYLKAHYPSEYMAAVLNSQGNIEKITFYMEECRRMNLDVLGPDINESNKGFAVNKKGVIRFGLNAVKGVGEAAVEDLINERNKNGAFADIFDLVKRVNNRTVNKRSLENLVQGGALDCFSNMHRAQYFTMPLGETQNNLERIIKYGQSYQGNKEQMSNSLFGDFSTEVDAPQPKIEASTPWTLSEFLEKEKEVIGMYITAHPLDSFKFEIHNYKIASIADVKLPENLGRTMKIAGFVSNAAHLTSKKGTLYCRTTLIDYSDQIELMLFTNDYVQYGKHFEVGQRLLITGGYQKRAYGNDDSYEFKIQSVSLLENVKTTFTKRINIGIEAKNISPTFINQLQQLCNKNTGTTEIGISIKDDEETINFKAMRGISFTEEILHFLQNEAHVQFKVNTSA